MRVQPLPAEEWDEAVQRSLSVMLPPERCNPRDAGNLMSTLARHPKLADAYLRFGVVPATPLHSASAPPRASHPSGRPSTRLRLRMDATT